MVKGWGAFGPPKNKDMKLALAIAKILIRILEAKNDNKKAELSSIVQDTLQIEEKLGEALGHNQLYKASLEAIQGHNESLEYRIEKAKEKAKDFAKLKNQLSASKEMR